MSDLLLYGKVRTVEGAVRGGERACGVSLRQIMAVAYQAATAAALSAARESRISTSRRSGTRPGSRIPRQSSTAEPLRAHAPAPRPALRGWGPQDGRDGRRCLGEIAPVGVLVAVAVASGQPSRSL